MALLPLIILAGSALVILLAIAFYRHHGLTFGLSLLGLVLALASLTPATALAPRQATILFIVDRYALFFMGLLFVTSLIAILLAYSYFSKRPGRHEELYLLLLLATLGSTALVVSSHFVSFFLGLETLTISLYVLIAYLRVERSVEAGLKYLILASVSSAFLLFGMALVYAHLGQMDLAEVATRLAAEAGPETPLFLTGLGLMAAGIGFKLAVVPFHMWTPDIYEGAAAPVTAFVATVSKGGMFAFLLRYFGQLDPQAYASLFLVFALIAAASMLGGNLLALLQNNVKRILAYSSIAHLGYLLVAFLAGGDLAITAVIYYLTAYFATTLAAFGVVSLLSGSEGEAEGIEDYRGLFWRRPWLAAVFTLALLSLAGIPLTAGFIGKFYVVAAGVNSTLWTLVILLAASSAIGLYYYLRLVVVMGLQPQPQTARDAPVRSLPLVGSLALAGSTLMIVWLGIYPSPLVEIIRRAIGV
jgi:NADH-quinone oxidoreductase subunit N